MHHSIPTDLGINGNMSFEKASALHEAVFGEPIKPMPYYENGPLCLAEDGADLDSIYPLENPTAPQKQETKRLWALENNRYAQAKVKWAYINRWLFSLPKKALLAELETRGVNIKTEDWNQGQRSVDSGGPSLTHWARRTISQDALVAMWTLRDGDM